jgi:hypothetical protein
MLEPGIPPGSGQRTRGGAPERLAMSRVNLEASRLKDCIIHDGNRFGATIQGTTTSFTVPPDSPHLLILTPTNATNVLLPASPSLGDWFTIVNGAGSALVLTVQTSAGAALVPPITPTQNEVATVIYCGATLGWRGSVSLGA